MNSKIWGTITWLFFHTLAEKIHENKFEKVKVDVINIPTVWYFWHHVCDLFNHYLHNCLHTDFLRCQNSRSNSTITMDFIRLSFIMEQFKYLF